MRDILLDVMSTMNTDSKHWASWMTVSIPFSATTWTSQSDCWVDEDGPAFLKTFSNRSTNNVELGSYRRRYL